jgi:hypothetical protein
VSREKKGECTKTTSTIHSENSHSIDFLDPKNGMFDSPKSRGYCKDNKGAVTPTSSVYSADAAFLNEGENADTEGESEIFKFISLCYNTFMCMI